MKTVIFFAKVQKHIIFVKYISARHSLNQTCLAANRYVQCALVTIERKLDDDIFTWTSKTICFYSVLEQVP